MEAELTRPQPSLATLIMQIKHEHQAAEAPLETIIKAEETAIRHALNAGDHLIEAKRIVGHGNFLRWLSDTFDFSRRTAALYMQLARKRTLIETAIEQRASHFTLRDAQRLLANNSRPARAILRIPEPAAATGGNDEDNEDTSEVIVVQPASGTMMQQNDPGDSSAPSDQGSCDVFETQSEEKPRTENEVNAELIPEVVAPPNLQRPLKRFDHALSAKLTCGWETPQQRLDTLETLQQWITRIEAEAAGVRPDDIMFHLDRIQCAVSHGHPLPAEAISGLEMALESLKQRTRSAQ